MLLSRMDEHTTVLITSAFFGSFMRPVSVMRHGVERAENELIIPLLEVWPLTKEGIEDNVRRKEFTRFDARSYVRTLENTFQCYDQNLHHWVLCSIFDNASVNKPIAKILYRPHVGVCHTNLI